MRRDTRKPRPRNKEKLKSFVPTSLEKEYYWKKFLNAPSPTASSSHEFPFYFCIYFLSIFSLFSTIIHFVYHATLSLINLRFVRYTTTNTNRPYRKLKFVSQWSFLIRKLAKISFSVFFSLHLLQYLSSDLTTLRLFGKLVEREHVKKLRTRNSNSSILQSQLSNRYTRLISVFSREHFRRTPWN